MAPTVEPMLALLKRELPTGPGLRYEPKWDGFRCLAAVEAGDLSLTSRNDRALTQYFPEAVQAVRPLGDVLLDGELVVHVDGRASFPGLMARLHPAASRVERLAPETPASYVVFDVLVVEGDDLTGQPFAARPDRLAAVLEGSSGAPVLTPQTWDPEVAQAWLRAPAGSGIDGVVVKPEDLRYQPGPPSMTKVKLTRTGDCVVRGPAAARRRRRRVAAAGRLRGGRAALRRVVSSFARSRRAELGQELAPLVTGLDGHPWEHGFGLEGGALGRLNGTAERWTPDLPRDWLPVRPERVAEVAYDHWRAGGSVTPGALCAGAPTATWLMHGGAALMSSTTVEVEGRQLRVSSLDRVLWPATGTTKAAHVLHARRAAAAAAPAPTDPCRRRTVT